MNRQALNLILLISQLLPGVVVASTYYIDSKNGNDGNKGRSEAKPWKSHTMAQEAELKPGDVVMFKCGSQFNGPIHITKSGTMEQPLSLIHI